MFRVSSHHCRWETEREKRATTGDVNCSNHTMTSRQRPQHCLFLPSFLRRFLSVLTFATNESSTSHPPSPFCFFSHSSSFPAHLLDAEASSPILPPPFQSHALIRTFPPGLLLTPLPDSNMAKCTLAWRCVHWTRTHTHTHTHTHMHRGNMRTFKFVFSSPNCLV